MTIILAKGLHSAEVGIIIVTMLFLLTFVVFILIVLFLTVKLKRYVNIAYVNSASCVHHNNNNYG